MNAVLRWNPVTTNTDGSLIAGQVTYEIYSFGTLEFPEPVRTALTYHVFRVRPHVKQCFYVRAVVSGRTSANSALACAKL